MRRLLWLGVLSACSDYNLRKDQDPHTGESGDTDTDTEDTAFTGEDCPDKVIPGFDGSVNEECENEAETGSFDPITEWSRETFTDFPTFKNVMMTPIVVSLTDDDDDGDIDQHDIPDIVFVTYPDTSWYGTGVIRALSGDDGTELWSDATTGIEGCSGLAAADIDGDGMVEIVGVTAAKEVVAYEHDGTPKWKSLAYAADMESYSSVPSIADMGGEAGPEIQVGRLILDYDGTFHASGIYGIGSAGTYGTSQIAVDLDRDGAVELVVGNAAYRENGTSLFYNAQSDGYVAIADFDADGNGDIVVSSYGRIRLQDHEGTVVWDKPIPGALSSYGGPPTIADYDGDGEPEVGVAANSTYTVFDTDGTQLWQNTTQDASSGVTGSAVYDFEGDGLAEAVYPDELHLWAFSGLDGDVKLSSSDHSNWTVVEYAPIADVDGDNHAEIVVPNGMHPSYSSARYGIAVIGDADDTWRPGRKIWNQHAYHITNIEDDGTLPATPALNWDTYNNFRSGDLGAGSGRDAPDATLAKAGLCEIDCDEGFVRVWVHAGNEGAADLPPGSVLALYSVDGAEETLVDSVNIEDIVHAGEFRDSVQFDVSDVDFGEVDAIRARIVASDLECDETNDEVVWNGPFCAE